MLYGRFKSMQVGALFKIGTHQMQVICTAHFSNSFIFLIGKLRFLDGGENIEIMALCFTQSYWNVLGTNICCILASTPHKSNSASCNYLYFFILQNRSCVLWQYCHCSEDDIRDNLELQNLRVGEIYILVSDHRAQRHNTHSRCLLQAIRTSR